ncbi:hypothetical protein C8T65DRAFT_740386 [Cerioporus squamosus]|nr:hypothetical protein C8T65DRAFT_740386 [Cerioporus squamosus]
MFRESLVEGFPRYRLIVDGHDYLVGKHIFLGFGMVGRGTRGYVALEWKTQRFVFLKDSWRPGYAGVEREGDILAKLNANDVENVPTIVRYGDVSHTEDGWGVQETEASRFHPRRGDKKVDTTLPPFQETVAQPSGPEKKFTRFVKKAEVEPTNKSLDPRKEASDPIRQPAHAGAVPDSEGGDPPAPAEAKSAPNLPAFDPGTDVPATPPPTTGVRGTKRSYDVFLAGQKRLQGEGLRHMVHTRLVVREICLPLTAFTGSKQFVRILYECLQAHALAYTKCQYMHRDISAGNMLIYPEIVRASDGRYGVCWRGLLTDWELAKHSGTRMAMQPQRTGTWHFMSAFLLLNPTMPTTIADELESFCHVLIYGCIRRVRSSLDTIHEFLNDYFAGGSWDPKWKQPACPSAKRDTIVRGQSLSFTTRDIVFSTPDGKMTEEHPLNKLISDLLAIFHSRYCVLNWEAAPKASAPPPKSPTARKTALPPVWKAAYKDRPEALTTAAPKREQGKVIRPTLPPTPEQYDNLVALESHTAILDIIRSYAFSEDLDWPDDDVVPDRQGEPHIQEAPRQEPAAVDALKQGIDPIPEVNEQDGVLNPGVEEKDKLEGGSSAVDQPEVVRSDHEAEDPQATAHKTEQVNLDEPVVRPAKRRRKDPVVHASKTNEPAAADLTMRRVTRSRSAANVAAAAAAAPPPPPVAAAPSTRPVATVAQASTRVTRSKSGKLPKTNATVARAGASTSGGHTTRRGGKTRSSAGVDRTQVASGPATRRRAAASQKTPNPNGGRRTRQEPAFGMWAIPDVQEGTSKRATRCRAVMKRRNNKFQHWHVENIAPGGPANALDVTAERTREEAGPRHSSAPEPSTLPVNIEHPTDTQFIVSEPSASSGPSCVSSAEQSTQDPYSAVPVVARAGEEELLDSLLAKKRRSLSLKRGLRKPRSIAAQPDCGLFEHVWQRDASAGKAGPSFGVWTVPPIKKGVRSSVTKRWRKQIERCVLDPSPDVPTALPLRLDSEQASDNVSRDLSPLTELDSSEPDDDRTGSVEEAIYESEPDTSLSPTSEVPDIRAKAKFPPPLEHHRLHQLAEELHNNLGSSSSEYTRPRTFAELLAYLECQPGEGSSALLASILTGAYAGLGLVSS